MLNPKEEEILPHSIAELIVIISLSHREYTPPTLSFYSKIYQQVAYNHEVVERYFQSMKNNDL